MVPFKSDERDVLNRYWDPSALAVSLTVSPLRSDTYDTAASPSNSRVLRVRDAADMLFSCDSSRSTRRSTSETRRMFTKITRLPYRFHRLTDSRFSLPTPRRIRYHNDRSRELKDGVFIIGNPFSLMG